ncbi:MAG: hypothetical protein KL801_07195 [Mesorhizobium sp.]|nr:hypothetical protein [Mesorhizobium sp.]
MKKLRLMGSILSAAAAFSIWMGVVASAEEPTYGGNLRISLMNDLKTLDPTYQSNYGERFVMYVMFNTIFSLGKDSSINPELAERWEVLDQGKQLVLYLRSDVKFHDGAPFDAEAVRWNLEHRMEEEVNSPSRFQLRQIIESIDVVDTHTVRLNLTGPSPSLLGLLAQRDGLMISPTAAQELGPDFGSTPIGTGPFKFKQWDRGGSVIVEKNPDYWDEGKPYLDSIEYVLTNTPVVGIPRLLTGEVDVVVPLTAVEIRTLEGRSDITIEQRPVSRWVSMQLRVDRPPYDDPKLRQAIAHAIDRERVVELTSNGKGDVAEGTVPPGLWWHDVEQKSLPYDPERAKELLSEIENVEDLELTITSPPDSFYSQIAQLVQDQLEAVGLNVQIQAATSDWYSQVVQGKISFVPMRWAARPDPDGLFTLLFHSSSPSNSTGYSDPEVDRLIDEARSSTDRDERRAMYFEVNRLIMEDLPYVPLFFQPEYAAMRETVGNGDSIWVADEAPRFRDLWKTDAR